MTKILTTAWESWPIVILALMLKLSVRRAIGISGVVKTIAGGGPSHGGAKEDCFDTAPSALDGVGRKARFNYPWGIVFDPLERSLYVADCYIAPLCMDTYQRNTGCPETIHSNDRIRKIDIETERVTTLAGGGQGFQDGIGSKAKFHHTSGMAIDPEQRVLYVADSGNDRIRKINLVNGNGVSGFVDGVGTNARVENPQSLAIDVFNQRMFLSDTDNHAIRVISLLDGNVTTLAGGKRGLKDGKGTEATFYHPTGLAFDASTETLYVADHYNHVIRTIKISDGTVRTLAGSGREGFKDGMGRDARFNYPEGIAFDTVHRKLYVVEFDGNAVRMVTPTGVVTTLAGGFEGYKDGRGRNAQFFHPTGLTFDPKTKTIYITDQIFCASSFVVRTSKIHIALVRMDKRIEKKVYCPVSLGSNNFYEQYNHMVRSISGFGSDTVDPKMPVYQRIVQGNDSYLFNFAIVSTVILIIVLACRPRLRRYLSR